MMRGKRAARGFTLIEMMIVVVIVGVLALLAMVAYQRWVRYSYTSEATDMVSAIRAAEESFKAENGSYYNVSKGLSPPNMYPAPTPGAFKTGWGGPCSGCVATDSWSKLTVEPKGPCTFGFAAISDASGSLPALTVNGTAVNMTAMSAPWYIVSAEGDTNGDGVFTTVYGFSATNELMIDNEGQ